MPALPTIMRQVYCSDTYNAVYTLTCLAEMIRIVWQVTIIIVFDHYPHSTHYGQDGVSLYTPFYNLSTS